MRKYSALVGLIACTGLVLAATACGSSSPSSTTSSSSMAPATIRVGVSALVDYQAWSVLAEQQGYFKQLNLKVTFISVPSSAAGEAALLAGSLDIVSEGESGFLANAKGGDIRTIFGTADRSAAHLITSPKITSLKQMNGQTFGGGGISSAANVQFGLGLKASKLPSNKIKYVSVGSSNLQLEALEAGKIQMAGLAVPWNQVAVKAGFRDWGFTDAPEPHGMGAPSTIFGAYATTQKTIDTKMSAIERFLAGTLATINDLYTDPGLRNELAQSLSKTLGVEESYIKGDFAAYFTDPTTAGTFTAKNGMVNIKNSVNTCNAYISIGLLSKGSNCVAATKTLVNNKLVVQAQKYLKNVHLRQSHLGPAPISVSS